MAFKITGNNALDYAVIPGAVIGALEFAAGTFGASGANVLGEGGGTAGFGSFLVGMVGVVLAIGLAYLNSNRESRFWRVILLGAAYGLSMHVVSSALSIGLSGAAQEPIVDAVKQFVFIAALSTMFYGLVSIAGIVLWWLESQFVLTKKTVVASKLRKK